MCDVLIFIIKINFLVLISDRSKSESRFILPLNLSARLVIVYAHL